MSKKNFARPKAPCTFIDQLHGLTRFVKFDSSIFFIDFVHRQTKMTTLLVRATINKCATNIMTKLALFNRAVTMAIHIKCRRPSFTPLIDSAHQRKMIRVLMTLRSPLIHAFNFIVYISLTYLARKTPLHDMSACKKNFMAVTDRVRFNITTATTNYSFHQQYLRLGVTSKTQTIAYAQINRHD